MSLIQTVDYLGFFTALILLCYGSFEDFKKREISNKVWIVLASIGLGLLAVRFYLYPQIIIISLISIGLIVGIAFALFYFELVGGADSKAYICIALIFPVMPSFFSGYIGSFHVFFPFAVLYNSFLLSIAIIVYILVKNTVTYFKNKSLFEGFQEEKFKKIAAFVSGYKTSVKNLKMKEYLFPIEEFIEKNGERIKRFKIVTKTEVDRDNTLRQFEDENEEVWVSPGQPMVIFITASFIVTVLFGDLLLGMISYFI